MTFIKKYSLRRILLFFSVFGPATITAMADNDAAGVATYSLAGAKYGYSILFILLIVTILLALTQEMGVRIAVVTGKGLGDLIRERYGVVISVIIFSFLVFANMGTIIANLSAIKATAEMFKLPAAPLLLVFVSLAYIFVSRGSYKTNQNIFLISALFYIAYIFSAIKSSPDWGLAMTSVVFPTNITLNKEFIFGAIAVLGTTITPWGQFFIQSYVIDKNVSLDKLKYMQFETYIGAFLTDLFSFFMIVATATTLFAHSVPLISGEQAALAIRPFAGTLASVLFGFGLLNAGFMGMIIVSLTTAYAFSEFFGIKGSLDESFERGKIFYIIFLFQLITASIIVMFPFVSLFKIVFFTQSFNGILLPFVFFFLLQFANNRELMGKYINNRVYNYICIIASIIIISASLFTVVSLFL